MAAIESKEIEYPGIYGASTAELGNLYRASIFDIQNAPAHNVQQMQFQTLREFLFRLLRNRAFDTSLNGDRDLLLAITSDENMVYWQSVFFHSSYNAQNNYEIWEYLGDKVLKHVFANYVTRKFPGLRSPKILTLMDNHYMGYEFQAKLSEELEIPNMIISREPVKRKDFEDVFEAIFGMLDFLVNKEFENQGYVYCFKFLSSIMDAKNIGIIEDRDPRSRFKHKLDLLTKTTNFVRPEFEKKFSNNSQGGQIVTVILSQTIAGNKRIIYQQSGNADEQSKILMDVSEKGIQYLEMQGYTSDAMNNLTRMLDERNLEIKKELEIYDLIVKQLNTNMIRSQRMITNYFFENKKVQTGKFQVGLNLVIRDTRGQESNQEMKIGTGDSEIEAKLDAIKQFNSSYPIRR